MGKALYRQYRPKKLGEVIGQEHITDTLQNALKQHKLSHAYLFTGPRGVGKTSVARILAHEANALPYSDDTAHIDIIEIDAASNRRIDEIRELRDKIHVTPTSAKYKVYIIDEVHMLTREAFNALLKTLEEPPAHVIFILATTDAHKVPETIISRTQRFNFKPVASNQVVAHLQAIAKTEKITITDEALQLLAVHGGGSFRDSIGLLDQAAAQASEVTADTVREQLGLPPATAITQLYDRLVASTSTAMLATQLANLYNQGFGAAAVADQLAVRIRSGLVSGEGQLSSEVALALLGQLLEVPAAFDPARYLEIVILAYGKTTLVTAPAEPATIPPASPAPAAVKAQIVQAVTPKPKSQPAQPTPDGSLPFDDNLWPHILQALKQRYNTLYGVIRMAEPTFEAGSNTLHLAFKFAFHQKRVNEAGNRKILTDTAESLTGQKIKIDCQFDATATPAKNAITPLAGPSDELKTVSNIFGGGELLES